MDWFRLNRHPLVIPVAPPRSHVGLFEKEEQRDASNRIPHHYSGPLGKAFLTTESVGRQLDPSFKLVDDARPLVEQVLRERLSPSAVAARVSELGHEAAA